MIYLFWNNCYIFTLNKTMEGCDMDFSDIRTIIIGEAGEYGKHCHNTSLLWNHS